MVEVVVEVVAEVIMEAMVVVEVVVEVVAEVVMEAMVVVEAVVKVVVEVIMQAMVVMAFLEVLLQAAAVMPVERAISTTSFGLLYLPPFHNPPSPRHSPSSPPSPSLQKRRLPRAGCSFSSSVQTGGGGGSPLPRITTCLHGGRRIPSNVR
jgi:hypothetical protein